MVKIYYFSITVYYRSGTIKRLLKLDLLKIQHDIIVQALNFKADQGSKIDQG